MARYDYTSALNDVNQALASDSISIVALIQRSNILVHLAATVTGQQSKSYSSYALASLQQASRLAPDNAYVLYNAGCLLAQQEAHESALQFSLKPCKLMHVCLKLITIAPCSTFAWARKKRIR